MDSELLTSYNVDNYLHGADGIIVPGGFGDRGVAGMILAGQYARENDIPYFGICLGMQTAAIEFARNVLGYADANSTEFAPDTKHPIIDLMPDQQGNLPKGGTMRLGAYPCAIRPGTLMERVYGQSNISERHRHRYEFNNEYRQEFQDHGTAHRGHLARRAPGRGGGNPRQAFLHRRAVPSRIQVPPQQGASALPRIHQGFAGRAGRKA